MFDSPLADSRENKEQNEEGEKEGEKDSAFPEIRIKDVGYHTFMAILTYIHTGTTTITKENCVDLLKAADLFLLEDLRKTCAKELTKQVTVDSSLEILQLADRLQESDLKKYVMEFVISHLRKEIEDGTSRALQQKLIDFLLPINAEVYTQLLVHAVRKGKEGQEEEDGPNRKRQKRGP